MSDIIRSGQVIKKDLKDDSKFVRSQLPGCIITDSVTTAVRTSSSLIIYPPGFPFSLHKYSKIEVTIAGESSNTPADNVQPKLFIKDSNNNYVQFTNIHQHGVENWNGANQFINRVNVNLCSTKNVAYNSFLYRLIFYPTGNSGNSITYRARSYGGDYNSGTEGVEVFTGRLYDCSQNKMHSIRFTNLSTNIQVGFRVSCKGILA